MKKMCCVLIVFTLCVTALAGCGVNDKDNQYPSEDNIQKVMVSIEDAEMPVYLTVENLPAFEGKKDMINGSHIKSNEKGSISKMNTCADFGSVFSGTYEVSGEHLEDAVFCFKPYPQKLEPITCGINFYDLIMDGAALDCKSIAVTYGKSVELKAVNGEFKIFFYILSEKCEMQFGQSMITVSGSLSESGTVKLSWDGTKFTLVSDKTIADCKAVTEVSNRSEQYSADADICGTAFEIAVEEGKPVIKGIRL